MGIAIATTPFGDLVLEAMQRKGDELGAPYSYRDLDGDSGVDYSHISKVVRGTRQPSRDVVEALARALAPHLDEDQAMIAAGYVPSGSQTILGRLARLPRRALSDLETRAMHHWSERQPPDEQAQGEGEQAGSGRLDKDEPHP